MNGEPNIDPAKGQRPQQRVDPHVKAERGPQHDEQREVPRKRTRTRLQSTAPATHDNYVNLDAVPPNVSLEWKRFSATGQESPFYLEALRKQGWEPVNPQEHPEWVSLPPGYDATTVIVDGLILMERPMELTMEARDDDKILAARRMKEAKQRLGQKTDDKAADPILHRGGVVEEVGRMVAAQAIEE